MWEQIKIVPTFYFGIKFNFNISKLIENLMLK